MAVTQRLLSEPGLNVESRQIRSGAFWSPRERRRQGRSIEKPLVIDGQDMPVYAASNQKRAEKHHKPVPPAEPGFFPFRSHNVGSRLRRSPDAHEVELDDLTTSELVTSHKTNTIRNLRCNHQRVHRSDTKRTTPSSQTT